MVAYQKGEKWIGLHADGSITKEYDTFAEMCQDNKLWQEGGQKDGNNKKGERPIRDRVGRIG